jgi:hypothetical protein
MFNPPNTVPGLLATVAQVLQTTEVRTGNWAADIQVGAYKLRLQPDPAHPPGYRVSQLFLKQVSGTPKIPRDVLGAMVHNGLF